MQMKVSEVRFGISLRFFIVLRTKTIKKPDTVEERSDGFVGIGADAKEKPCLVPVHRGYCPSGLTWFNSLDRRIEEKTEN